ncbi:nucleotidyltransferase family protein [Paenibacillus bovis]|uniref:MobA-like NTP transferase domain-containing protein n=1 Tax=Paenibacillus bovis TaxID=1616788 RepID=A0A172ZFP7_9BACL|nr:nucleotidyltransferase family protein [Paenibacillus bovis]ANF96455.1 hypothetical protein AR543_10870 [Paenibacillus bovis]
MSIAALVLAAGKSSRMGKDKLSLPLPTISGTYTVPAAGQPATPDRTGIEQHLYTCAVVDPNTQISHEKSIPVVSKPVTSVGGHVLKAILAEKRLSPVVIVHAPYSSPVWRQEVLAWCERKNWQETECADADRGMSYSIRCGMERIKSSAAEAVMILLADQPLVDSLLLGDIIDNWQQSDSALDYIAASDGRNAQPPVIMARHIWDRLDQLTGDQGARQLFRQPDLRGRIIPYAEHYFWDADTPDALQRIRDHIRCTLDTG